MFRPSLLFILRTGVFGCSRTYADKHSHQSGVSSVRALCHSRAHTSPALGLFHDLRVAAMCMMVAHVLLVHSSVVLVVSSLVGSCERVFDRGTVYGLSVPYRATQG